MSNPKNLHDSQDKQLYRSEDVYADQGRAFGTQNSRQLKNSHLNNEVIMEESEMNPDELFGDNQVVQSRNNKTGSINESEMDQMVMHISSNDVPMNKNKNEQDKEDKAE